MLRTNAVVACGTFGAGLIGVVFQALISHRLHPAEYGAVFTVVTLQNMIWLPATALTLLVARETSRGRAQQDLTRSRALLVGTHRALWVLGIALVVLLSAASPWLATFLSLPSSYTVASAIGIPFGLALPLFLGELQGQERFTSFSVLSIIQAGLKMAGALALGALLGPLGIVIGVSAGTACAYVAGWWMVRQRLSIAAEVRWEGTALRYLAIVLPSTVAISLLLSADVLLAKHLFPTTAAGEYAAVAALGRAIFWGAMGVSTVLFPKVIFREAQGQSGQQVVTLSLALVALGGIAGFGLLTVRSSTLLTAFAGAAYEQAARYVPWYGAAMVLLGLATVLIATHQSRGRAAFLTILIPVSLLEPVAIALLHTTLLEVIQVVDACMAVLFGGLVSLSILQQSRASVARLSNAVEAIPAPVGVSS